MIFLLCLSQSMGFLNKSRESERELGVSNLARIICGISIYRDFELKSGNHY